MRPRLVHREASGRATRARVALVPALPLEVLERVLRPVEEDSEAARVDLAPRWERAGLVPVPRLQAGLVRPHRRLPRLLSLLANRPLRVTQATRRLCLELEVGVLLQQLPAELLLAGSVWGRLALRRSVQVVERSNHFDVVAVSDKRGGRVEMEDRGY